jgi:hypothetical protein
MAKIRWHNFPDELPTCRNGQAMYVRCHEVQSNKVRIVNLKVYIGYLDREGMEFRFVDKEGNDIYDVAQWAMRKERKK